MIATKFIRPLTKGMTDSLLEIYERETSGELCGQEVKNIAGLYTRGLIELRSCINQTGKPYMGFCITSKGKDYLQTITKNTSIFNG